MVLALTCQDRIFHFSLLTYVPQLGHLITYCSCDLHTADYQGDPFTNVNIESNYYAGYPLQSLKFKFKYSDRPQYLFQVRKNKT